MSLGAIYALVALNADPRPNPRTPFDQRPLPIFFSSVAGIIGLIAGHVMVALAEAWADTSSPSH